MEVKFSRRSLYKGVVSTIGAFGAGQFVRLVASIILTRLLTPELFGIMAIVNSVKTGIDLISDVGAGQNIVQNKNAEDPHFYNTAWTLKAIRGVFLCIICAAATRPVADFYNSPILNYVLPAAAFLFIFEGFTSISPFLMQKRLKIFELNVFGFMFELIPDVAMVALAYFYNSIWALIGGLAIGSIARMVTSFFLLGDVRLRFYISKEYTRQMLHFGKWIFLSSIVYFFSMNFDRLYLGKVAPFGLLGIYGVARSISGMIVGLISQLCGYIVFPYVSSFSSRPKEDLHAKLVSIRLKLLLVTALGLSAFAAVADLPIKIIYDHRYHAAAGMLPFLTLGVWFSIISNINESILLGYGTPQYATYGNVLRLIWFLVGLPASYAWHGFYGVVLVVAVADIFRYLPILIGQIRMRISFGMQDALLTFVMFGLFGFFVWLRWSLGLGIAFSSLIE